MPANVAICDKRESLCQLMPHGATSTIEPESLTLVLDTSSGGAFSKAAPLD